MPECGGRADDDLRRRLGELEARVARLEQHLEPDVVAPPTSAAPGQTILAEGASAAQAAGRALLGLAGAYLLRPLTESHLVPQTAGVFAAIVYGMLWLVWAARTPPGCRVEAVLHSCTSALVIGPLLWESTLRLRVVSTGSAATVLLVFTVFGLAISWRKNLTMVAAIATCTGVLTAAALLIGSHDVVPFMLLLLAIAAVMEVSACLDHRLGARWLTAAAADLAVLLATYLVTNGSGLPESYGPLPPSWVFGAQLALCGIYFSSTLIRTLVRGSVFSGFEAAQLAATLLLLLGGGLRLAGNEYVAPVLAGTFVVYGAVCYAAATRSAGRNFRIYLAFGFLLVLAGAEIALPAGWAAAVWSVLAVLSMTSGRPALRWHGCGYLLSALAASGVLAQATALLLGADDRPAAFLPLAGTAATGLVCYGLAVRAEAGQRALRAVVAAAAFWPAAGIGGAILGQSYHSLAGALAPHAYCATIRTAILAWGAVLLARAGSRWKRPEIRPLVYSVMVLGAYRLLLIDLRQDSKTALVASLLAYGAALMVLPRLIEAGQTATR